MFYEIINYNINHKPSSFDHYELICVPIRRYHIPLYLGERKEYNYNNPKYIQTKVITTPMAINKDTVNEYLIKKNQKEGLNTFFNTTKKKSSKSKSKNKDLILKDTLSGETKKNNYLIVKKNMLRNIGPKPDDEFVLQKNKIRNKQKAINLFKGLIRGKLNKY